MGRAQTKDGAGGGPAEEQTCARGRYMRLLKIGESRTRMRGRDDSFANGSIERDLNSLRNGTYKWRSDRKISNLGSESIYTNTCQFEVRDQ